MEPTTSRLQALQIRTWLGIQISHSQSYYQFSILIWTWVLWVRKCTDASYFIYF